jgi:adenylyltransferase/sulfurtransferase
MEPSRERVTMPDSSSNELTADERLRYGRHLILPEIGAEGQARLKRGSVLLVGVGGLGCPAALYLAAAGVGRLGLVDDDRVDASNLHRQVLYGDADVGRPKVEVAAERLRAINPAIRIETHATRVSAANAARLVGDYDVVLDGADNFPTRYLLNDACVMGGRPLVQGSVHRFEGQASVYHHDGGPCFRCLFPTPPPADSVPDCAAAGVLGILPGLIGLLQATEAIKLLTGIGRTLAGRLMLYDALAMTWNELPIARDPQCPVCGDRPSIRELHAEEGCAVPGVAGAAGASDVSAGELRHRLSGDVAPGLIDVREADEFDAGHLAGARLIPLGELEGRLDELNRDDEWVVYCHSGIRSGYAVETMRAHGFSRARNLRGGWLAWNAAVEPTSSHETHS